jgi:hypothetical protein
VTSIITPPLSISAKPVFNVNAVSAMSNVSFGRTTTIVHYHPAADTHKKTAALTRLPDKGALPF